MLLSQVVTAGALASLLSTPVYESPATAQFNPRAAQLSAIAQNQLQSAPAHFVHRSATVRVRVHEALQPGMTSDAVARKLPPRIPLGVESRGASQNSVGRKIQPDEQSPQR